MSIISSIVPMESLLLSKCCVNLELLVPCLKSLKCSWNLFVEGLPSLAYIFFLAVFTSQLMYAISVEFVVFVISNIVGGAG